MANNLAFQPMGPTYLLQATAANTQGATIAMTAVSPVQQYNIVNTDSANIAYVAISTSSNVTATIPTGTGSNVFPIPWFGVNTITAVQTSPTKTVYATIISNGTCNVLITPGEGL